MARRTIRTIDGQVFSGRPSRFENRKGYVLYLKSQFHEVRINKRAIISDDTSGLPDSLKAALVIIVILFLAVGVLLINRKLAPGEGLKNVDVIESRKSAEPVVTATPTPLPTATPISVPVVIASTKSGYYYLPTCAEYSKVKPLNKVEFASEQEAVSAGFHWYYKCPR